MPGVFFDGEFTSPRPLAQRGDQLVRGPSAVDTEFGHVLKWTEDGFQLADPIEGIVSGLCVSKEVTEGDTVELLTHGNAESKDWTACTGEQSLTPGAHYYLISNGKLSTIPSSEGYILRVGRAVSPTVLYVTFDLKVA